MEGGRGDYSWSYVGGDAVALLQALIFLSFTPIAVSAFGKKFTSFW